MYKPEKIRNIAIIAHIDHGKTTLLDSLLHASAVFRENEVIAERAMDSYELEKERGITIFAKHTSLYHNDFKINIIDTPGHADFSGEVERILGMVNSVLLLVDAQEGPMPQTRFVLSCALKMGLCPIVILNKIDRPHANPDEALNKTFDLFVELGANDEQLDFSYCYVSGLEGYALKKLGDEKKDMEPLFELITEKAPAPSGNLDLPFLMQATTLSYDDFIGRGATGRILEGIVKKGQEIALIGKDGHPTNHKVVKIEGYHGLKKVEMDEAGVGDIVSISGMPEVMIGDTLCTPGHITQLPPITLSEPTLSINVVVNGGPFVGKDGKHVTMNKLRDRLNKEKRANISLTIEEVGGQDDVIRMSGRGELHLSVVLEAMRREGFEFLITKPQVIIKQIEGVKNEPLEHAHLELPDEFTGAVIEKLSQRKGEMQNLSTNEHMVTSMEFIIPTRGLIGFRNDFLTMTKGQGIITSLFDSFSPWKGDIPTRKNGSLISMNQGRVTAYAAFTIQERGTLFVKAGDEVYEGMIIGEHARENDLLVNITREKKLTNVRASGTDENIVLIPARVFNLEQAIDWIQDDEFVEITPNFLRIRKQYLTEVERKRKK
ncbi:MAG: translational GTPase TypA [Simkaniaceae bacterium]|nr:translational GTPase TypA [Simkaniaceae bacterium]